jgi:hypothetical protein
MKKVSEWFELLSEKEQQQFKENCEYFEIIMSDKYISFELFLMCSFTWSCTNEGYKYWEKISKRKL